MHAFIAGVHEVSSIDYPGHLASVVFLQGCNLKCRFCHNSDQLNFTQKKPLTYVYKEITKMLQVIDSVVVSGGEAMIQEEAIIELKKWCDCHGLLFGVETNGTFPTRLKRLMEKNTFDFIAMDVKSLFNAESYAEVTRNKKMYAQFFKSFQLLKKSKVPHEFRMTVTPSLHTIEDILEINKKVKPSKLILQRFQPSDKVMDKSLNKQFFSTNFVKRLKLWAKNQKNVEMHFWD